MNILSILAAALLGISANVHYLATQNSEPFFWLGNTTWLMPEKLTREEVTLLLDSCKEQEYNVVQVQVVNGIPATNVYGSKSGSEAYWEHMDFIVEEAARRDIQVGMVCVWGGLVKKGLVSIDLAEAYGKFLGERYRGSDNIVWIIGGDVRGDVRPEVWNALARAIKRADTRHLMTFHPFGRTNSLTWWNDSDWLDFNMFQSGHRRYDQKRGDGGDELSEIAEDNWRYVEDAWAADPVRPVLDGEPSYEDIPQGLHDPSEPRWQACDCRRYAYWSVFAGACGHTYGHNSIMQMHSGAEAGAYDAHKSWKEALSDPGYGQMKYLRRLIEAFPYECRVPAQDVLLSNGERYSRISATKGSDYILAYTYDNSPIELDLSRISGTRKHVWWYNPSDGGIEDAGECKTATAAFQHSGERQPGNDWVLVVTDWKAGEYVRNLRRSSESGKSQNIQSLLQSIGLQKQ